jgi:plasmid maintenance system antidote protein VapI
MDVRKYERSNREILKLESPFDENHQKWLNLQPHEVKHLSNGRNKNQSR